MIMIGKIETKWNNDISRIPVPKGFMYVCM